MDERTSERPPHVADRFELFVELSVDAIMAIDSQQRITLFNPGAEAIFGYTRQEILGQPLRRLLPERFRDAHDRHIRAFAESPETSRTMGDRSELLGLRKNGEEFPAEGSITKYGPGGSLLVVLRDLSELDAAHRALLESEARWHRMADALPILLSYVDAAERYGFANKRYVEWFGVAQSDVKGQSVRELLGQATYAAVGPHLRSALEGNHVRYDTEIVTASGKRRHTEVVLEPDIRDDGGVAGVYVAALDITARKHAEERLRHKERAIRALQEIGAHPALALDEKIRTLLELGCDQLDLDHGVLSRVVGDRYEVKAAYPASEALRAGAVFPLDRTYCHRTVRAGGPIGFSRASGSEWERHPAFLEMQLQAYLGVPVVVGGEVYGTLSFSSLRPRTGVFHQADRDLVRLMALWMGNELDRARALDDQALLADIGRILSTSLDEGELAASIVGRVVPALGDACMLYALGRDGTVSVIAAEHQEDELRQRLRTRVGTVVEPASSHPVLDVLRTKEILLRPDHVDEAGRTHEFHAAEGLPAAACRSLVIAPMITGGSVRGAMAVFSATPYRHTDRDLDAVREVALRCTLGLENARLYRDSRDAVRTRDELLSFVTHDLGSPLSSVAMVVDRLLAMPVERDRRTATRSYLEGVQEAAGRMERLIGNLLDVDVLEKGQALVRKEAVSPSEVLTVAVQEFRPRCEATSLHLEIGPVADDAVRADPDRLMQVLSNLLDNAVKFTDPGGRVEVRAEATNGTVTFSVSDTGEGIPEDRLGSIFDRYAQAHEARRAGVGLGLAIVKEIVEAHGGRIWVESQPGRGSTFYFTLPRV